MRVLGAPQATNGRASDGDGWTPPHDGSHPVRLVLLVEVFALLSDYGYRRPTAARSTAQSLRLLNALTVAFEAGR